MIILTQEYFVDSIWNKFFSKISNQIESPKLCAHSWAYYLVKLYILNFSWTFFNSFNHGNKLERDRGKGAWVLDFQTPLNRQAKAVAEIKGHSDEQRLRRLYVDLQIFQFCTFCEFPLFFFNAEDMGETIRTTCSPKPTAKRIQSRTFGWHSRARYLKMLCTDFQMF